MSNLIETSIPWIGQIPPDWDIQPLFSVATENKTKNVERNENVLSLSYGRIIRRDLSKNFGLLPENFDGYQVVERGYIIIRSTDLQNDKKSLRVGLVKENGVITSAYIGLSPSHSIHPEYLFYYLNMCDLKKVFYSLGGGLRQSLRFEEFKRFPVIVPSIEQQKLISCYLDKKTSQIDSLVEKIQKKIELLKEQRSSLINHYVTKGLDPNVEMKDSGFEWIGEIPKHWKLIKLSHYTRIIRGSSPRPAGDPKLFGGDYIPWITVKEVTNSSGKFIEKTNDFLTEEGCKRSTLVKSGTLLFSNSGATLGVPRFTNLDGCINDGSVAFLDIRSCVDPEFLYYFLGTQTTRLREEQKGFGQPNLNTEIVSNIKMPLPTIVEQRKIVAKIEETTIKSDAIIEKEENRLKLFSEYRQSLISSIVTGKVRVTEGMA